MFGNEPEGDCLERNHKKWFMGVTRSFPAGNQQEEFDRLLQVYPSVPIESNPGGLVLKENRPGRSQSDSMLEAEFVCERSKGAIRSQQRLAMLAPCLAYIWMRNKRCVFAYSAAKMQKNSFEGDPSSLALCIWHLDHGSAHVQLPPNSWEHPHHSTKH